MGYSAPTGPGATFVMRSLNMYMTMQILMGRLRKRLTGLSRKRSQMRFDKELHDQVGLAISRLSDERPVPEVGEISGGAILGNEGATEWVPEATGGSTSHDLLPSGIPVWVEQRSCLRDDLKAPGRYVTWADIEEAKEELGRYAEKKSAPAATEDGAPRDDRWLVQ